MRFEEIIVFAVDGKIETSAAGFSIGPLLDKCIKEANERSQVQVSIVGEKIEIFAKVGDIQLLKNIHIKINDEKGRIAKSFQDKETTSKREVDSFVEPLPPLIELKPEPGELVSRLIK